MYSDGILFPLNGKAKNDFSIYAFDVETEHTEKIDKNGISYLEQNFMMGSIYGDDIKEIFWDKKEMMDSILSLPIKSYIVATNLEFDFSQLFYNSDYMKDFKLVYRHGLKGVMYDKGKLIFSDTMNYINVSVKKLGEKICNIKKLDYPPSMKKDKYGRLISSYPKNNIERIELERYNINDSRISYEAMKIFQRFCSDMNMRMKMTIGSCGLDYWRRNHQRMPMEREPDDQLRHHLKCGVFRGGAVCVFKRGYYPDKLYYYDFRSSYPGRISEGVDGKGNYPFPGSFRNIDKMTTEHLENYEGFCFAKIDMPKDIYCPILGIKTEQKKLIFPVGIFEGWFTNLELRNALDIGADINMGKGIIYPENFIFAKEAAELLYNMRKKYKKENHPYSDMIKVLMNSGLFGKYGTDFTRMTELIASESIEFASDGRPYINGEPVEDITFNGDIENNMFFTREYDSGPLPYSFPILSTYTTALARIKLFNAIHKFQDELIYCDTDSAVMTRPCLQEEDRLGGFEMQYKASAGIFVKPKLYMLYGEKPVCKAKGVTKVMDSPDGFVAGLKSAMKGDPLVYERFMRLRESQIRGVKSGSVYMQEKKLSLEDDKRIWKKKFNLDDWQDSNPINLNIS